jgi:hypothetical protein
MQMKVVMSVVLLALVQLVTASPYEHGIVKQAAPRNKHDLVVGCREYGDRLLYR